MLQLPQPPPPQPRPIIFCKSRYVYGSMIGEVSTIERMINKENKKFKTVKFLTDCLTEACKSGHTEVVKTLLGYKSRLWNNIISFPECEHILYCAGKSGDTEIINLILDMLSEHGPDKIRKMWSCGLYGICCTGKVKLFKTYMNCAENNSVHWNNYLACACKHGKMKLILFIINQIESLSDVSGNKLINSVKWNKGLKYACICGDMKIINLMITKGADDWNKGLKGACRGGNMEIVYLMISKGADNWDIGFAGACRGGHVDIAKNMLKRGVYVPDCLHNACKKGYVEIVELILRYNDLDFDRDFYPEFPDFDPIVDNEYIDLVDINHGLEYACYFGKMEIAELLIRYEAVDWDEGLTNACQGGHIDLVKLMIDHGATNFNDGLISNTLCMIDTDIINLMISHGADEYEYLARSDDFKLYNLWVKSSGINSYDDPKYLELLSEYPPYVLFIGCMVVKVGGIGGKNICHTSRLPTELFRLLFEY